MTELIRVGDRIKNSDGDTIIVAEVQLGKYGLFVEGTDINYRQQAWGYLIPELPASDVITPWYGWAERSTITLAGGAEFGCLCWCREDGRKTLAEYDDEWERTLAEWEPEPMGCIPLAEAMNGRVKER